jgi:DNA-binding MarR family transcriptional regulator
MVAKRTQTPAPKPSVLPLQQMVCFAVYSTNLALNKAYRKPLQELGLTYLQYLAMIVLWEKDQQMVSEIGEKLFLDSATLTPLLKRLESMGFISRNRSPSDERQVIVALTREGRELKSKAKTVGPALECAADCAAEELDELKTRLEKLRANLLKNS